MTVRAKRGSRSVSVATSRRPVRARRVGAWARPSAAAVTTSTAARSNAVTTRLLLEEVVEGATDIAGTRRVGRGVALDRDSERERGALVGGVLVGDLLRDRLRALEAPTGLEVRALAAGVDGRAAVRALFERRVRDRQDGPASRAARDGVLGQHAAASGRVGGPRWRRRRRRPARLGIRVPVALLAVLAVAHGR